MNQIQRSAEYPASAQYAMLTKDGNAVQAFYKMVEEKYYDSTTEATLYQKSSLPCWMPSAYTLDQLLLMEFDIVSIGE